MVGPPVFQLSETPRCIVRRSEPAAIRFPISRRCWPRRSPLRSGDVLAGIAAETGEERVAAQFALADLPLATFLTRARRSLRDRRGDAPHHRHARPEGVRADRASDCRRLSRLAAVRRSDHRPCWPRSRPASRPRWRPPSARSAGLQDLMVMRGEMRGRDPLPQHRSACPAGCRCGCSPIIRPTTRAASPRASSTACCSARATPSSASTRRPTARSARIRCSSMLDEIRIKLDIPTQSCVLAHVTTTLELIGKGAPVDLVFQSIAGTRGGQQELRRQPRAARGGARGRAVAEARHGRRQRDVFRDRPGQRALGQRPSRRRPADARGARLCGRARVQAAAGQHRGRLHRPGISVRRQADHPRRPGGSFLRQAAGPADGLRRLLHQPCRGRPGRHGRAARRCWSRPASIS